MRIYPKKLHNLADLEREKEVLKYAEKQTSLDDLFSFDGILGNKKSASKKDKKTSSDNSNNSSSLGNKLDIAKMIMDAVLAFGLPRSLRRAEKQSKASAEKPKKNILVSAAVEFVGGYLKWKAISLGLKGVSHLLKKSKKEK
jgi:hypothetical protein